jgi:phosphoribosylformimino-5-aminoimidazole carboxamide ribotide isomerase
VSSNERTHFYKGQPLLASAGAAASIGSMRILPVLDLKGDQVVRGLAGRRHEYQPIVSRLTPSCRPMEVARAFRAHFGLIELYLADLDAIAGAPPALPLYATLQSEGFRLWIDAGIRTATDGKPLAAAGVEGIIVGLETVQGPLALAEVCRQFGKNRIVFSLDLKDGQPLGDRSAWRAQDTETIAAQAVAAGVRRLIVLDLAKVGTAAGTGTEGLVARLAQTHPQVEVVAGGGVQGVEDLRRLQCAGARAVLVASALHDGRLRREQLEPFLAGPPLTKS